MGTALSGSTQEKKDKTTGSRHGATLVIENPSDEEGLILLSALGYT